MEPATDGHGMAQKPPPEDENFGPFSGKLRRLWEGLQ